MKVKRLLDVALGQEKRQRVRAKQLLLSGVMSLSLFAIFAYGIWSGVIVTRLVVAGIVLNLSGLTIFYGLIRSGVNLRFVSDPALTLPQGVFSVLCMTFGYAIGGPIRGAVMLPLAVTIVFGIFALTPRQVRNLSLLALVSLGSIMLFSTLHDPQHYPVHEEALHFMLAALSLPMIAVVAGQLSTMREKLRQHRADLERALERNHQLATRDELTSLHNRRHVLDLMTQEVKRAERSGQPMCLALLDIDHFKRINDTHGHAGGDEALRTFAQTARAAVRDTDALGRWGGEEFILMLPDTNLVVAEAAVERIRQKIAEVRLDQIAPELRLSFSAGITEYRIGETLLATIERTDQTMYRAKQAGRNLSVAA